MRKIVVNAIAATAAIASLLLNIVPSNAQQKMKIVASFSILGDFVKNVGGDLVEVKSLAAHASAFAEPVASSMRVSELKCRAIPGADLRSLTLDEREEIATGTWGRSVHPLGPDYFRVNRHQLSRERSGAACKP